MSDADAIEGFLDTLWMERGLSENTLNAYRADLTDFARFANARRLGLLEVEYLPKKYLGHKSKST